jgi:hypothetical protein
MLLESERCELYHYCKFESIAQYSMYSSSGPASVREPAGWNDCYAFIFWSLLSFSCPPI